MSFLLYWEYKDGFKDGEKVVFAGYKVCIIKAIVKFTPVSS